MPQKAKSLYIFCIIVPALSGFLIGQGAFSHKSPLPVHQEREGTNTARRRAPALTSSLDNSARHLWAQGGVFFSKRKSPILDSVIEKLLKGEQPEDWKAELKKILEYTLVGEGREEALHILFSKWAEVDFAGALEGIRKMGAYADHSCTEHIFAELIKKDIESALFHYEQGEKLPNSQSIAILKMIAKAWAAQDPEKALEWAWTYSREDSDIILYDCALIYFMQGIGFKTEKTREYIDRIQQKLGRVPSSIIHSWAREDLDSAQSWVKSTDNGSTLYQEAIFQAIAGTDLPKALEMFEEFSEKEKPSLSRIIAENMRDSATSVPWLFEAVPPSRESRGWSLYNLGFWASDDPEKSGNWVRGLPPSLAKDLAVETYIEHVPASLGYDAMKKLIDAMEDTETRERTRKAALQKWKLSEPGVQKN